MSTIIRPSVSEKNEWYIEKHRYYELKHFCLQYPTWEKRYNMADGICGTSAEKLWVQNNRINNPTEKAAEIKAYYSTRIDMLWQAAKETDPVIGKYILKGIFENKSYDSVQAKYGVPCCKDVYYKAYRKFFYILSKLRD